MGDNDYKQAQIRAGCVGNTFNPGTWLAKAGGSPGV